MSKRSYETKRYRHPGNPNWTGEKSRAIPYVVKLRRPHEKQELFIESEAKRNVVRAGRRSGKTVGVGTLAVKTFLKKKRFLYGAPTKEQIDAFWFEVKRALQDLIDNNIVSKNEVEHTIEIEGTKQRIKAKTVWNADTLRGDYADVLCLDEWQLMNEDTWEKVGAPMMLDTNGTAYFLYTPPSLHSRSVSKADDPTHAARMYREAQKKMKAGSTRWQTFHFTSHDNPHISKIALADITEDMTSLAIRQEIDALDIDEAPSAQWTREILEEYRVSPDYDDPIELVRIVVAVDPPSDSRARRSGCGIMIGGIDDSGHGYLLEDATVENATPSVWAERVIEALDYWEADRVVAEINHGGEMVSFTVRAVDPDCPFKEVRASRGKQIRAEPIAAKTERGLIHLVGNFKRLEDELCLWEPGLPSPHRLDAFVWLFTELMGGRKARRSTVQVSSIKR